MNFSEHAQASDRQFNHNQVMQRYEDLTRASLWTRKATAIAGIVLAKSRPAMSFLQCPFEDIA
jgi:hypothetical protein